MDKLTNPWRDIKVHRIHVFAEHGISPSLVEEFCRSAREVACRTIVDPFVGSGVVVVEAQRRGFNAIGVDANPWPLIVCMAKTSPPDLRLYERIVHALSEVRKPLIPSKRLAFYHPPGILRRLGLLRATIELVDNNRSLALTVFGSIAERFSLLRRSPAPRFHERRVSGDPVEVFLYELRQALQDLSQHSFAGIVDLVWADSVKWMPRKVPCVLTSPPFANNIDYVRHTQLQLLWAGLARDSRSLGRLRDLQVPASEASTRCWKPLLEDPRVNAIVRMISGKRARGYRRFLRQYFYAMDEHFRLLSEVLEWEAWYTIGDSELGGMYIPTHKLLADLASKHGLRVEIARIGVRRHRSKLLGLYLLRLSNPR